MSELKKVLLRKIMLKRQKNLSESYIKEAGEDISAQIFSSRLYQAAKKIFVYVSMPKEPPTHEIIKRALNEGKEIYVPKCHNRVMIAARIYDMKDLELGVLGILEPKNFSETLTAREFDLMIVPCLAASVDGQRLGHGAGYYDKFLADGKNKNIICLCFSEMLSSEIPMSKHDVFMPSVLTERKKINF